MIVILTITPLFVSEIYTNNYLKPSVIDSAREQLHTVAQSVVFDLSRETDFAVSAIYLLADLSYLHNWISSGESDVVELNQTLATFKRYVENLENIGQIRYINSTGFERIRYNIDYSPQKSINLVSDENLQFKGHRKYYLETSTISFHEVYISHINLNIENGVVEYVDGDVVPTIRYGTPIYINGTYEGIIAINFLYYPIYLQRLDFADNFHESSDMAIIDNDGLFLFSNFNEGWSAKENLNTNLTFTDYFGNVEINEIEPDFSRVKIKNRLAVIHKVDIEFSDTQFQIYFFISISELQFIENIDNNMNLIYIVVSLVIALAIPIIYFLPITQLKTICAVCKKIRNQESKWIPVEQFIGEKSTLKFSHGYCPECYQDQIDTLLESE